MLDDTDSSHGLAAAADSLSKTFLAGLPAARRAEAAQHAALEERLRGLLAAAQSLEPGLAARPFLTFLGRSLGSGLRSPEDLGRLRLRDLLVVYGYGRKDPDAQEVIERHHLPEVERSLRSYGLSDLDLADIRQLLRQRLCAPHVSQPGSAPYSGRGELLGWLRVMAIREARCMLRHQRRALRVSEQEAREAESLVESVDVQHLKAQYWHGFRQAFDGAVSALNGRERDLLRYTYISNLGLEELALIYRVHRATVARWMQQLRRALLKRTRRNLQQQRGLAGVELDDILPLIWGQIDVSLSPLIVFAD